MHVGKLLRKMRREIDNNFIKDFGESAFEIADMWECRIYFKILFIETLAFTVGELHVLARDSVKVSSDTFTWIWNKYLRYTVRYILHRRYRFRCVKKSGYRM
jgi:hypothetical protein